MEVARVGLKMDTPGRIGAHGEERIGDGRPRITTGRNRVAAALLFWSPTGEQGKREAAEQAPESPMKMTPGSRCRAGTRGSRHQGREEAGHEVVAHGHGKDHRGRRGEHRHAEARPSMPSMR